MRSKQTETWPLVSGPDKPNPALHLHSNDTSPVVYWSPAGRTERRRKRKRKRKRKRRKKKRKRRKRKRRKRRRKKEKAKQNVRQTADQKQKLKS